MLAPKLVRLARAELGVEEVNGTNCGPRVDEYKAATWLNPKKGWPWCAAFICFLVREAMKGGRYTFKRPRTAGAWDFENWSKEQDASTHTLRSPGRDIEPGDIVIYTFSHIGLATARPDANGYIRAIEGNTDAGGSREGGIVAEQRRHISKVKTRIRFTV